MSSPASLRDASANDPKVKAFLDDVWSSLGVEDDAPKAPTTTVEPPSGLEAIQKVKLD